ncbi:hypothetical protein M434DRAFT_39013 [Hypoxylon sp. CO27-5]|nr:hypothetical protein M434DRAFT_39013 [Hypoxylon sp. CO27-5]
MKVTTFSISTIVFGNTTLDTPVDQNYQNPDVLDAVSSAYLVGSTEAGLDTINCIPYVVSVGQSPC